MRVSVQKEMVQAPTRRIGRLTTEIHIPHPADHPQREVLERAALTCPVHASLHPDAEKPTVSTTYPSQNVADRNMACVATSSV